MSALSRIGLPAPFGAAVILILFFAVVGYGIYRIWTPGIEWLERAPHSLVEAEGKLRTLRKPVEAIQEAGEQVEAIARGDQGSPADSQEPPEAEEEGGLGDTILERHYVLVTTVTNLGLGVAVGLALWILGMPNPVLWGVMAGVLNYIPYLGGMVGYAVVGVVAFTTFEDTGQALRLNPVMVFTWLIFWGWIWGIPGALLAIPLLAMTKIVADKIETLAPLGAFLGR